MVVMALDHTRDYFHFGAQHGADPLDLATTTPWLFLTRWITHYCAPLFSFLAGTGVFLSTLRGKSKRELSWFLLTRGLWLVLLELTFFKWAWTFSFDLHQNWGLVIWSLGWSMVALAALIHLPVWAVGVFGVTLMVAHNALDGIRAESWGSLAWLWHILHLRGPVMFGEAFRFRVGYPLIPWVGVMAAGYAFGAVYRLDPSARRRWLVGLGIGLMVAFVDLRFTNAYGDAMPWGAQPRAGYTVLSFLNCVKYPPSLCYLLMTLGPGILLLGCFEGGTPAWLRPFLVFGRVPFFYYFVHIPLIHALAVLLNLARIGSADVWVLGGNHPPPPGTGVSLLAVYLVWAAVMVGLYPLCRWFADLKRRRREAWLTYF